MPKNHIILVIIAVKMVKYITEITYSDLLHQNWEKIPQKDRIILKTDLFKSISNVASGLIIVFACVACIR